MFSSQTSLQQLSISKLFHHSKFISFSGWEQSWFNCGLSGWTQSTKSNWWSPTFTRTSPAFWLATQGQSVSLFSEKSNVQVQCQLPNQIQKSLHKSSASIKARF
jgi:hypothetical protein